LVSVVRLSTLDGHFPKTKKFSKQFIPRKNKDKKPFQKEGVSKEKMGEETRNEFRRNNIFFNCKDPWEPGHKCMGKGKTHYIEVLSNSEEEEDT
jgi:hypothetical protein